MHIPLFIPLDSSVSHLAKSKYYQEANTAVETYLPYAQKILNQNLPAQWCSFHRSVTHLPHSFQIRFIDGEPQLLLPLETAQIGTQKNMRAKLLLSQKSPPHLLAQLRPLSQEADKLRRFQNNFVISSAFYADSIWHYTHYWNGKTYKPRILMTLYEGDLVDFFKDPLSLQCLTERRHKLGALLALDLHRLHSKGLVHKDVKPENICINQAGYPRFIDFDICSPQGRLTGGCGTKGYSAPEALFAEKGWLPLPQADIFGLAMTLLFLEDPELFYPIHFAQKETKSPSLKTTVHEKIRQAQAKLTESPDPFRRLLANMLDADPEKRPPALEVYEKLKK